MRLAGKDLVSTQLPRLPDVSRMVDRSIAQKAGERCTGTLTGTGTKTASLTGRRTRTTWMRRQRARRSAPAQSLPRQGSAAEHQDPEEHVGLTDVGAEGRSRRLRDHAGDQPGDGDRGGSGRKGDLQPVPAELLGGLVGSRGRYRRAAMRTQALEHPVATSLGRSPDS